MFNRDFYIQILQRMNDVVDQVPNWAWVAYSVGAGVIISLLFGVLVWFLRSFLQDNKESWKEIRDAVGDMVKVTTKHDIQIFEIQKDVLEMRSDIRGLPNIKQHR